MSDVPSRGTRNLLYNFWDMGRSCQGIGISGLFYVTIVALFVYLLMLSKFGVRSCVGTSRLHKQVKGPLLIIHSRT